MRLALRPSSRLRRSRRRQRREEARDARGGPFRPRRLGRVRRRFRDVESARIDLEENDFAKARAVQFQGRARDFAGGVVVDVADRDGFRRGGREAPRAEERGEREAQFLHR